MNPVLFRHTVPIGDYAISFESLIPKTIAALAAQKNSPRVLSIP